MRVLRVQPPTEYYAEVLSPKCKAWHDLVLFVPNNLSHRGT